MVGHHDVCKRAPKIVGRMAVNSRIDVNWGLASARRTLHNLLDAWTRDQSVVLRRGP